VHLLTHSLDEASKLAIHTRYCTVELSRRVRLKNTLHCRPPAYQTRLTEMQHLGGSDNQLDDERLINLVLFVDLSQFNVAHLKSRALRYVGDLRGPNAASIN
jgi:hypothetical protein